MFCFVFSSECSLLVACATFTALALFVTSAQLPLSPYFLRSLYSSPLRRFLCHRISCLSSFCTLCFVSPCFTRDCVTPYNNTSFTGAALIPAPQRSPRSGVRVKKRQPASLKSLTIKGGRMTQPPSPYKCIVPATCSFSVSLLFRSIAVKERRKTRPNKISAKRMLLLWSKQ